MIAALARQLLDRQPELRAGAPGRMPLHDPETLAWRDPDGTVCAACHLADGEPVIQVPGVAEFRAAGRPMVVSVLAHPGASPARIQDVYHRFVVPLLLQLQGAEVLHASAVAAPGGVIAFCADSGIGKSSTAFMLVERGLGPWADDTVVLERTASGCQAIPMPFWFRLDPELLGRCCQPARAPARPADRDTVRPLRALCLLKRRDQDRDADPTWRSVRAPEAFRAILPHAFSFTLSQPERTRRMLDNYVDLCAAVPVFEVAFRPDLERLPALLGVIERAIIQACG